MNSYICRRECSKRWADLTPLAFATDARHCGSCDKPVALSASDDETSALVELGLCIALADNYRVPNYPNFFLGSLSADGRWQQSYGIHITPRAGTERTERQRDGFRLYFGQLDDFEERRQLFETGEPTTLWAVSRESYRVLSTRLAPYDIDVTLFADTIELQQKRLDAFAATVPRIPPSARKTISSE